MLYYYSSTTTPFSIANERRNQRITRRSVSTHQQVRRVSVTSPHGSVDGGSFHAKHQVLSPPSSSTPAGFPMEFGSERKKIFPLHTLPPSRRAYEELEEIAKESDESLPI